jgi:predicted transcriptional regulator
MSVDIKRITIRMSPELHRQLHQVANAQSVSLNTLAIRALEAYVETSPADQECLPIRELSALLAPAAEATELTEEELLHHARQVRRQIWQDRYERTVQALADQRESR